MLPGCRQFRIRPRRRHLLGLLAIVLGPPLAWAALVGVCPTEWARRRVEARLEAATGLPARVGALRLGALGGVRLESVALGRPNADDGDPALRVASARVDLSLARLAWGDLEASELRVEGADLRVIRDAEGRLNLADLLAPRPDRPTAVAAGGDSSDDGPDLAVRLSRSRVVVIDQVSGTRLVLEKAEALGVWSPTAGRAELSELRGQLNGGTLELAAAIEPGCGPARPLAFEGQLRLRGVRLGSGLAAPLGYLLPIAAGGRSNSLEGRLDLDLALRGRGESADELVASLAGCGEAIVDPIRLDGSALLAELAGVLPMPGSSRIGAARSRFVVGGGGVSTESLRLAVGRVPIELAGRTGFDGTLDYRLRGEALTAQLPDEARRLLEGLPIGADDLVGLHLVGTLDQPRLEGGPAGGEEGLRELGRRLRDRLLR